MSGSPLFAVWIGGLEFESLVLVEGRWERMKHFVCFRGSDLAMTIMPDKARALREVISTRGALM